MYNDNDACHYYSPEWALIRDINFPFGANTRMVQSQCPPVITKRASFEIANSLGDIVRSGTNGAAIVRLNLSSI